MYSRYKRIVKQLYFIYMVRCWHFCKNWYVITV
ncbi:Uncharacterised protein [Acinetobacter baumannii]|nr:Uncharacterised protein [Acinetobacter baumannii]SVK54783.1 Uncharacterised protein [Acinetobacter baumannii]